MLSPEPELVDQTTETTERPAQSYATAEQALSPDTQTVSPVTVLPNAPTAHCLPLVALTGAAGEEPGVVRGSDGEASFHAQGTNAAAVEPSSTQEGGEHLTERSRRDSGLRKLTLPVRFSLG